MVAGAEDAAAASVYVVEVAGEVAGGVAVNRPPENQVQKTNES